jgi:hypothetical protein
MKFILTFTLPPDTRDEAITRFLETSGQPPSRSQAAGPVGAAGSVRRGRAPRERGPQSLN